MEPDRHRISELLRRSREGDREAFAELFEPYRPLVIRVACRLAGQELCDEAVLDTCLKGWRALPRFTGAAALGRWWCTIARNATLDLLRQRQRRQLHEVSLFEPVSAGSRPDSHEPTHLERLPDRSIPTPEEQVCQRELGECLDRGLARLSAEHRAALLLREVDGLSYREIAAATGVAIGTVMSRLFHARRNLRKWILLEQHHETGLE
ncbi:MAG: sigma-70 family RNA polymerase sigma factor [Lentisphaeria bacterium]|jgi:RNA polymerase sigma-70 factor (ECF subfamily)